MKTIFVNFGDSKKKYSFNTNSEVNVGDVLETNAYDAKLTVIEVLDRAFNYVNLVTGDLTDEITGTNCFKIKLIKVIEADETDVIVARRIERA